MKFKYKDTIMRKIIGLFFIAIILQIPIFFINNIIFERSNLYIETVENIGNEWGLKQTLAGPFLIVPFKDVKTKSDKESEEDKNNTETYDDYYIVLPNKLKTSIKMTDDIKKRGIYKSTVYNANVDISGNFEDVKSLLPENIKFDKVYYAMGITDTKALMKVKSFNLANQEIKVESGTGLSYGNLNAGISGEISKELIENTNLNFNISFDIRGSEGISVLPFANDNEVLIDSTWSSPKFSGILPNDKKINEKGFSANWNATSFVRNYKQSFKYGNIEQSLKDSEIDVDLYNTITHYTQINRAIKYSILFIMLTIFVVYLFEILSKKATHYIQYGVVGFSLVMFYLLLLSLSEYLSFELSYLISSLMVIIPNALYINSATKNKKFGLGIFLFLSGIYVILFSILRMEQYALLTGTLLLMLVLYIIMYLTRNMKNIIFIDEQNLDEQNVNLDEQNINIE